MSPLVRCKHCRGVISALTRYRHLDDCAAYQRRRKLGRMSFEKDGKRLYAIAVQRRDPHSERWLPEMHYAHGFGPLQAKHVFLSGERDHSRLHIVDVGLAIGAFMNDRDGRSLSLD